MEVRPRGSCESNVGQGSDASRGSRPRSSSTNRRGKVVPSGEQAVFRAGIDWLEVSFPLSNYAADHRIWRCKTEKPLSNGTNRTGILRSTSGYLPIREGVSARLGVCVNRDNDQAVRATGRLSFN